IGGFGVGGKPPPPNYIYPLLGPAPHPAPWGRALVHNTRAHQARAGDPPGDGLPGIGGGEEKKRPPKPPPHRRGGWGQSVTASGTVTPTTTPVLQPTTTTTTGTTNTTLQVVLQPDPSTGVDTYLTAPANSDGNWGTLPRAWVGTDERNAQRPLM